MLTVQTELIGSLNSEELKVAENEKKRKKKMEGEKQSRSADGVLSCLFFPVENCKRGTSHTTNTLPSSPRVNPPKQPIVGHGEC